jgi:hypothetical protein
LFGSDNLRANALLAAVTTIAALYVIEGVLQQLDEKPPLAGATFPRDTRTQQQVVRDLRAAGVPAYLTVSRATLRDAADHEGSFTVFRTDENGFNNTSGLWAEPVDLVVLGDSFVFGACVDSSATLVAQIRRSVPRTLGAGIDAFGPLSMLAVLEEYVAEVRPRDVLWLYFEWNDLRDLQDESAVAQLDLTSSQHLRERAAAIDPQLVEHIERELAREQRPGRQGSATEHTTAQGPTEWIRLVRLRRMLALDGVRERLERCCDLATFEAALVEAKRNVESWGGRLHFVYLPAGLRYHSRFAHVLDDNMRARGRVLRTARRVGLPILDVHAAFVRQGDAASLFYSARSHYNERGYRVVADAVVTYLESMPTAATR